MKTVRLLIATTLALAALGGLVLTLAWAQPAPIRVEDALITPTVPLTLPPPWLSDDDVVDAPYHWWWPTVDGRIDPGEYAGAGKITFPGYGGDVEVFFKQDGDNLYVAFDFPDPQSAGSAAQVFLDTNHDVGTAPQTDDYRFSITRSGSAIENQGTGTGWSGATAPVSWTAAATTTLSGWQAEFRIQYDKLGLTAGTFQVMGLSLINAWTPGGDYYWPSGAFWTNPSTWGDLVSSSDWTTFYWKPGPWEDYAPSGMPDFDQMQLGPTYCGPFAAANSLWWFDSKFETPDHPPPGISDTYRLVWPYGPWDDHDPQNVSPLANDLAWYFDTDGIRTGGTWLGTYVTDMHSGTLAYLRDHGLWDDYIVTLVEQPDFDWIADEVQRSEDVILLLGFWEWQEVEPGIWDWVRIGGHYVTVAGVEPGAWQIAFSDPAVDNAEQPGPGRVLSGTLIPHIPIPGHPVTTHNDAGNVSHDVYQMVDTNSPGGTWGPMEYPWWWWIETGFVPNGEAEPWQGGGIQVEVEFALSVSPFTWKASGEWHEEEMEGWWVPFEDYAPNGVPDFDQKQDNWGIVTPWPPGWQWTFCGPAAAANSLWWFDSKFEPSPVGPPFPPPPWGPIPPNDNYPLVQSYDPAGLWDDHDPLNVDDPATPWPPGGWPFPPPMPPGQGEFVEDLAIYFQTDQIGSGTVITNLYTGIEQYITDYGLRQGYVITMVESPDFWWVAEEVEVSEDVIILLGFWEEVGIEGWKRIGGHYLTLPGIDKQGGLVAFSDPYYDGAEYAWPYAYPTGWPTVMGRVADGWLTPHPPWGHASDVHNDAGNISHDVYYVVGTDSPGGSWGPWEYVEGGYVEENFLGQNGDSEPYTGGEVQAEVEWAVAVSPVADVWITKTVVPTVVVPGEWVTFTITFGNGGSLPAENVVISDVLPSGLVNPSVVGTWNNYGGNIVTHDTFTWTVGSIPWQGWGIITVTAQISPTASGIITNTAEIATSSVEQYQVTPLPNVASASFIVQAVQKADVTIIKTMQPANVVPGDFVTYTLIYANNGLVTADNTVITDILPTELIGDAYTYTNDYGATITHTGRYIWDVADVPAGRGGIITVTAQINPALTSAGIITNQAFIGTTTPESDYTNNDYTASQNLCIPPSGATFVYTPPNPLTGQTVTFTGSVALGDPAPVYTWDFDDGTGSGNPVTHVYGSAGTYTVWMTATNSCGQACTSTVIFVGGYGVALTPDTAHKYGSNGATVVYTFTVQNTGNVSDNYNLSLADDDWPTILSTNSVGPLAPSATASVQVSVTVPLTARGSAFDRATVTAQSATSPTVSDTSVFTTTTIDHYAMHLAPPSASQTDNPGKTVTYTLTIHNDGNVTDTYDLTTTLTVWPTSLSTNPVGPVAPWGNAGFQVYVTIPSTATNGDRDIVTVTATSQGAPAVSDHSVLITTATQPITQTDVVITKTVQPADVVPGDFVTYTLAYANDSPVTAANTLVTDSLPSELTGDAYSYSNDYGVIVTHTGRYVWDVGDIPAGRGGVITVTAQINPALTNAGTITNQAFIGTTTPESDYTNNDDSTSQGLCIPPAGASFIYAPLNPLTGQTVVFTGSVARGDPPPTYTWDFGDGSGSGNPATHIYNSAGTYTVWMTATNSCGQVVYSDTVSVCEPAGNASIQYAPAEPWVNQTVFFTATATGSGVITYDWAADDGWSDTGATTTHAFTTLGNHTVWLTATNSCGQAYASEVILVRGYGVDLQPPSGSAIGKPGGWITYTLTLYNAGNVTDTYNITGSVTGEAWPTNWPATVGPVAGGGNAQLDVTVQISSTANDGDWSRVVITATSQGDGSKKAASVLTTTVTTQPVVRDVEIAPHTAAQTGDVGTTVTYTLRVTNTGTISDYFNLSVSGPAWGTVLSVYGLDLKPGEGQPVEVYVQILASAISGAQDAATVTARSAVAPAVADSAVLTTTAYVPTYGVELTPLVAQQAGHPGDVMTYTLTVRNTGERDDTYTLSKGLHTWPTTLSVPSVGPLAPNGIAQFSVTVQIPGSVSSGTFDTVQVTATSQKDNSKSDTAVLTTTAIASTQPITRGVTLTATITAREGIVGDWITYTLRVTNTGNVADFFNLTWQGNTWPVDLSAYGLSLGAGQGADVLAYVQPPLTASDGATDTVTIKATSANDATATDGVALTTTARWRHVYLPLVLRNHQ